VIEPYPDLYNENYVDLPTGDKWQATIAEEQAYAQSHRQEIVAADRYLSANAQLFMKQFARTFTDFICDFTFYIAPSFGRMDGSAAFVNGEHRIIFAPDVIPRYHKLSELKVLIDHETFHIYHHQATGRFGASPEAVPTILEALWGEGLATLRRICSRISTPRTARPISIILRPASSPRAIRRGPAIMWVC